MAKQRGPRRPCPTPHKEVFRNHRAALATAHIISKRMIREGEVFHPLFYYQCPCGSIHTTRRESWDGVANLPLLFIPVALQEWARTPAAVDDRELGATRSPAPAHGDASRGIDPH